MFNLWSSLNSTVSEPVSARNSRTTLTGTQVDDVVWLFVRLGGAGQDSRQAQERLCVVVHRLLQIKSHHHSGQLVQAEREGAGQEDRQQAGRITRGLSVRLLPRRNDVCLFIFKGLDDGFATELYHNYLRSVYNRFIVSNDLLEVSAASGAEAIRSLVFNCELLS